MAAYRQPVDKCKFLLYFKRRNNLMVLARLASALFVLTGDIGSRKSPTGKTH
jgi:hypothetical protein